MCSENYDLKVIPRFTESRPGLDFDLESRKRNIGHMTKVSANVRSYM
jgi:hypothetical protein